MPVYDRKEKEPGYFLQVGNGVRWNEEMYCLESDHKLPDGTG
jgi:hypothetical protein